jgi:hypothetical protein
LPKTIDNPTPDYRWDETMMYTNGEILDRNENEQPMAQMNRMTFEKSQTKVIIG